MYGQPESTYNEYTSHQDSNFSLGHGDMSGQLGNNGCSNYGNFYENNGYNSGQHDLHDRYSGLPTTCSSTTTFSTYNDTSSKVSQDRSYIMDYSTSGPTGLNQNYNFPYWSTETNCSTQHDSWGMGWSSSSAAPTTTTTDAASMMTSKMLNADQKSVQSVAATLMSNQQQTGGVASETETATSAGGYQNKIPDFYCLPIFSPPPSNVYSDSVLEWNSRSIVSNANYC